MEIDGKRIRGALLGAAAMYFLDPDRGRRRRAQARDRLIHLRVAADDALDTGLRDLRNRARGVVARTAGRVGDAEVSDDVLASRVRAVLGRVTSHPSAVEVRACQGVVELSGPVLAREVERLREAVEGVRGVENVIDRLEVHRTAASIPGLQGDARPVRGLRPDVLQENWAPGTRLWVGAAGVAALLAGRSRGGVVGRALAVAGAAALARALSNRELRRLVGLRSGRRAVDLRKTIHVNAPVEEVFSIWQRYEEFPRFMAHLRAVNRPDGDRSHWVAAGPAGTSFEWDAIVTRLEPNRSIAWKSLPGAVVGNAGVVRFDRDPRGGTRIDIRMTYNPPGGVIGHAIAALLGVDPKRAMDEDLVRLKSLIEEGRTSVSGTEVRWHEPPRAAA